MATASAVEGTAGLFWFHYDLTNDVLYLRRADARTTPSYGEEDDHGNIVLRAQDGDTPVGMTIPDWWKRIHQSGPVPDSISRIASQVEPWAERLAAA